MTEKIVEAVVLKAFTSTMFGNLVTGQKIEITQQRFNVWKAQGLVDYPKDAAAPKSVTSGDEAPDVVADDPQPKAPAKKKGKKRKGKARK